MIAETSVELDQVQDVGGLRCAVRRELVVVASIPVRVVEIDIAQPVAVGGQDDDPGAIGGDEPRDKQSRELEVAQMVCAELHLEAVGCSAEGGEHHRVVHQHMDGRGDVRYRVGSPANVGQRREVQRHGRCCGVRYLRVHPGLGIGKRCGVACRHDDMGAGRGERPCRLAASSADAPVMTHVFPTRSTPSTTSSAVGVLMSPALLFAEPPQRHHHVGVAFFLHDPLAHPAHRLDRVLWHGDRDAAGVAEGGEPLGAEQRKHIAQFAFQRFGVRSRSSGCRRSPPSVTLSMVSTGTMLATRPDSIAE